MNMPNHKLHILDQLHLRGNFVRRRTYSIGLCFSFDRLSNRAGGTKFSMIILSVGCWIGWGGRCRRGWGRRYCRRSNIGEALKWLFCTNGLLDIGTLKILSPQYLNLAWVFVHALQIFWSFSIIARCSALVTLQLFAPNPVANRALSLLTLGYIFEVQMLTRVQAILQSSFLQTNPQAWNLFSKSWIPASVSANTCEGQLSKHHHASLQQTPAKLLVQAECWCFILNHYQLILNCRRYKSI
jgi:hypothetical protein